MKLNAESIKTVAAAVIANPDLIDVHFEDLYEYYVGIGLMPYEVAKDDPFQWIETQLTKE